MKKYLADLHVHTCLSPCADTQMSPRKIVQAARRQGLDIIAVCDHNSCENAAAVIRAAGSEDLRVLPGMEVTSREEVHVVALFEKLEDALALQVMIYQHLQGENDQDAFGVQVVVNELSEVLGFNERLLIGATDLSIDQVVEAIHRHAGLAVAAHIDRMGFGIIAQLGFIPDGLGLDALEVSSMMSPERARGEFKAYSEETFISSSDAHSLDQIGRGRTQFIIRDAHLSEISKAFRGAEGRAVLV